VISCVIGVICVICQRWSQDTLQVKAEGHARNAALMV